LLIRCTFADPLHWADPPDVTPQSSRVPSADPRRREDTV
jgi:hypothetical protein